MAGIPEYLEACNFRKQFLREQLRWLRAERQQFGEDAKRLQAVEQRVRQELIGYLLPEVQDLFLAGLEQRISYPGLLPIKAKYDAKFEAVERRSVELEQMDEFQQYDFLLDRAQRDVDDIQPKFEAATAHMAIWEQSKWFKSLNQRKYFELGYAAGFFRRILDWRAESFLMAHLTRHAQLDFETPEALKQHFRQLRDETADVVAAYETRVAERDRICGIKQEHGELLRAPERLLGELFGELGDATVAHLDACPEDLRIELARRDSHLNAFLRKLTGVRKQLQYLSELPVTRVDAVTQQLEQELAKVEAKIKKLTLQRRRGKRKKYADADIVNMRNVKQEKWARRQERTARLRQEISAFDRYDHGSFVSSYLWWDIVTHGAIVDYNY